LPTRLGPYGPAIGSPTRLWPLTPGQTPHNNNNNNATSDCCGYLEDTGMAIRPLQDRVIVKRVKEDEKTKGGIIIPDTAKEKPVEGKVVAVGNGAILKDGKVRPLDVKKGNRVLFGKYSGTEIKIDGEDHVIMREEDILAVIED